MSRADTIAVRDGCEALHMDTKEPRERGCLNLTDLRKTLGYVRNRAVMLAQLLTDCRRQSGSHVPVLGQGDCECLGRGGVRCGVGHSLPVALFALGHPRFCKPGDGVRTGRCCEEFQSLDGEVVVRGIEHRPPGVSEHKDLGRAAATARAVDTLLAGFEMPGGEQDVEVAPNRRWGQPQPLRQLRRSRRPMLENRTGYPVPRRCVGLRVLRNPSGTRGDSLVFFHNTSVP